jgi:hypothetical protein
MISGYSPTWFGPDDPLTREQMTTIAVKATDPGNPVGTDEPDFQDSPAISAWAAQAVAVASQEKLVSGYPDDTFQPQALASRAEAVMVINKALNLK